MEGETGHGPVGRATRAGALRHFLGTRPGPTAALVGLLILASVAEGFGVLTLLPLLDLALRGEPAAGVADRAVLAVLGALGVRPTLGALLVAVTVAVLLKGLLRWTAMRHAAATVARVARDLREGLVRALVEARWDHLCTRRSGEVATAVGRDAFWGSYAYRHGCSALAAGVQAAVYAGAVVVVSWEVGVLALLGAAALALPMGIFVRHARKAGAGQTDGARALASGLLDVLGGLKAIRSMGRESAFLPLLDTEARALERAERRQVVAAESLRAFREPLLVLLLAPAVWLVLTRTQVPLSILLVGVFLFHRLISRTGELQSEYQAMAAAEAAFQAVRRQTEAARDARELPSGLLPPPPLRRALRARGVTFARGGRRVLRNASVEAPAGLLTVLVGPSGAGKTTLLDVLVGLHRPDAGNVEVDGILLEDIDRATWRGRVGYVPQETFLLHDTVARNVALGDDADPERIRRALRRAGARPFVVALPEGVDTVVGEHGARLSGGERQRIALARALFHDPALLVLDEPTSGLDPRAEADLLRTLRGLRGEVTVVAASHGAAMAAAADRVYEIHGGVVREREPVPPLAAALPGIHT